MRSLLSPSRGRFFALCRPHPVALLFLFLVTASGAGCAEQLPDHVELTPPAEEVEFAADPPSPNAYKMVGQIVGEAAANDPDQAAQAARNDLRNKAAALGASLVTVDEDVGEALLLQGRTKVRVTGRAYKSVD